MASRRYARGDRALAECQRSGKRVPYRDLVEDGHVKGLMVAPDWYEPKHPQESPVVATDSSSLHRPSPEFSAPPTEGVLGDATPNLLYQATTTLAVDLQDGMHRLLVNDAVVATYGTPIWVGILEDEAVIGWVLLFVGAELTEPTYAVPLQSCPHLEAPAPAGGPVYIGPNGNGILN